MYFSNTCLKSTFNSNSNSNSITNLNSDNIILSDELIDQKYLEETIAEWKKPLPTKYITQPLVISGPSAVGKARLIKALLKDYSKFFKKVVTHTTRLPRDGEIEGVDYHFIDKNQYQELINNNEFIEHATVHGNLYGVTKEAYQLVIKSNKIPILEIDVQGVDTIKKITTSGSNTIDFLEDVSPYYIFMRPISIEALRDRLQDRGTESPKDMKIRLENAKKEIFLGTSSGFVDRVITNDDFGNATTILFRTARDFYPQLPNPGRIRSLQRQWKRIKEKSLENNNTNKIKN